MPRRQDHGSRNGSDRPRPGRWPGRWLRSAAALALVATVVVLGSSPWAPSAGAATLTTTVAGGHGPGDGANQLHLPRAVARDGAGNLFVADSQNHRVQRWAPGATEGVTVAGGNGPGNATDQLDHPFGIALDATGDLFIADLYNHRVQRWAPGASHGETVAGGNGPGAAADQLSGPMDVALEGLGNVYVTDSENHRVQRWAPGASQGETVAGGNGPGDGADQFFYPNGIALDGLGSIYVADPANYRVQRWPLGGSAGVTVVRDISGAPYNLVVPTDVAVDGHGNLYVADIGNDEIQVWTPGAVSGVPLAGHGRGDAADQFDYPQALLVGPGDTLTVVDALNHRVQQVTLDRPRLLPGRGSVDEGDAGFTTLEVPVTLSHPTQQPVTVRWSTVVVPGRLGQAEPGTDYDAGSGTITLDPGQSSAAVSLTVRGDDEPEDHQYIVVSFRDAVGATIGGFWGLGFGVILDDDQPSILPGSGSVREGTGGGPSVLTIPVTLSEPSPEVVTASWTTLEVPGSAGAPAQAGLDYAPAAGEVRFAPGQTQATVAVDVATDSTVEPDEYVLVSFSAPTNARIGGNWGLGGGTIVDDDVVSVIVGPASVVEGTGGLTVLEIPVRLSNPSLVPVTATWSTSFVSVPIVQAQPGTDYVPAAGTILLMPGETSTTLTVQVVADAVPEDDEALVVGLQDITGTTDAQPLAFTIATVIDDD